MITHYVLGQYTRAQYDQIVTLTKAVIFDRESHVNSSRVWMNDTIDARPLSRTKLCEIDAEPPLKKHVARASGDTAQSLSSRVVRYSSRHSYLSRPFTNVHSFIDVVLHVGISRMPKFQCLAFQHLHQLVPPTRSHRRQADNPQVVDTGEFRTPSTSINPRKLVVPT